jgi:phosphate starvation-inducible protein PhoH
MKQFEKYHGVFLIAPDPYLEGGDQVLQGFSRSNSAHVPETESSHRNLIVFPLAVSNYLNQMQRVSPGAQAALAAISQISPSKGRQLPKEVSGGTLCTVNDSLDMLIVNTSDRDPIQSITTVCTNPQYAPLRTKHFEVVTDDASVSVYLAGTGIAINPSKFLNVDKNIIRRVVVDVDPQLYPLFCENNGKLGIDRVHAELGADRLASAQWLRMSIPVRGEEFPRQFFAKYDASSENISLIDDTKRQFHINNYEYGDMFRGIRPKNLEQYVALQHVLLNPEYDLVIISGPAGCGKTLLAYASLVDKMLAYRPDIAHKRNSKFQDEKGYGYDLDRLLLTKGDMENASMGFLPGDLAEKASPAFASFADQHRCLDIASYVKFTELFEPKIITSTKDAPFRIPYRALLEVLPPASVRGRSISNGGLLCDETQNITPFVTYSIATRMSLGSKFVFTGDPYQVDAGTGCTPDKNGLNYLIRRLLNTPRVGIFELVQSQRHPIVQRLNEMPVYAPTQQRR